MIGLHRWTAQTARQTEFARCTPPIPIMSYKSDFTEPSKLFKAIPKALVAATVGFTSDDLPCLLSLFFDNLSTLVGVGGAFTYVVGDYANDIPLAKEIMSKRVYPACGIMLFLGNFYMVRARSLCHAFFLLCCGPR